MQGLSLEELQRMGAKPVQASGGLSLQELQQMGAKSVTTPQAHPIKDNSVIGEGVKAGLESASNLPSSAYNFAKNTVSTLTHPIDTLSNIGNAFLGGVNKLAKLRDDAEGKKADENFSALITSLKDRYGSLENLQRTATTDPFGFGTDVLSILEGGAGLAGKTELLNSGISRTAGLVTKPVAKTVGTLAETAGKTTKFGVSQMTGLNPETLSTIVDNSAEFSKANLANNDRATLAQSVKSSIDSRLKDLSTTGKEYQGIRESSNRVAIPTNLVPDTLKKYGLDLVDGKIKMSSESVPISAGDRIAIEDFISVYGNEAELSGNSFMNTRSALSKGAKYDATKTADGQKIFRDLRSQYDSLGKEQIPGLKVLDEKYAPEVTQLNRIRKDYLDKDGNFKDGAINKIANLNGAGKDQILGRLEEIHPGVGQRIKIVKAAEDIENASGIKVGTYARAIGVGGQAAIGNYAGALITAILASPEVAVPLIRSYGLTKLQVGKVAEILRVAGNDVNNFRLPGKIQPYIEEYLKNPQFGLSIEDVSKSGKVNPMATKTIDPLISEASKYKGADEFVKAQGTPVYHGTNVDFDAIDLSKSKRSMFGKSFSVTDNPEVTKYYGEKTKDYIIAKDAKIYNSNSSEIKQRDFARANELYKEKYGKDLPISKARSQMNYKKEVSPSRVFWTSENPEIVRAKELLGEEIKGKGFDIVKEGDTYAVLNLDVLKTKSQLTDIWKKAQNKSK